jgi:transposase-like protein
VEAHVPDLGVLANPPPRLVEELRRRTRVATLFPNAASLLRLVSAMAAEISEEWETGQAYLTPAEQNAPPPGCAKKNAKAE